MYWDKEWSTKTISEWLINDELLYNTARLVIREAGIDVKKPLESRPEAKRQRAVNIAAKALKDWAYASTPVPDVPRVAYSRADWKEIAVDVMD